MIDFYNAFISYRHAPLDSKVAEHVQRSLEHFHIPAKIKKKTGKKKIERIFRDKDELPITSDLTDTISNALAKADYLIVICSPNTKESMWVRREIQFFLKNHTKNQILTVLADGEPMDVIPDELKFDERVITNEVGIQYTVKVPIEPLSCDYRMPLKKAQKEELPRLASAIIGCSYDELVRRQRQYKMRRLAIIMSALLAAAMAFAGYMFYSRSQIDKAYIESMASQSRYLANESEKLLEDERRIDALRLALAALPKDENDERPVTSEAIRALTEATLAYTGLSGTTINAAWNYSAGNRVSDIEISEESTRLAACDIMNTVTVWDTESHEKLFEVSNSGDDVRDMVFLGDEVLVVAYPERIVAYDTQDGHTMWDYDVDHMFLGDILVLQDGNIIVPDQTPQIAIVNTTNGDAVQTIPLPDDNGDLLTSYTNFSLSPDGTRVGFSTMETISSGRAGVLNLATGKVAFSGSEEGMILHVGWADDQHFIIADHDMSQLGSSQAGGSIILANSIDNLICYNASNMSKAWEKEFPSLGVSAEYGFIALPEADSIGYYGGNSCRTYDINTGALLYDWTTSETIADVSDRDGDGTPLIITTGGAMAFPLKSISNDALSVSYEFTDDISLLTVHSGVYVVQKFSSDIIFFDTYVSDEEWVQIEDLVLPGISQHYMDDRVLAIISNYDEGAKLTMIDPEENELITQVSIGDPGDIGTNFRILGTSEDLLYIVYSKVGDTSLLEVDLSSGEISDSQLNESYMLLDVLASMSGDKIAYYNKPAMNDYRVGLLDIDSDRKEEFSLPYTGTVEYTMSPRYFENMGIIYVAAQQGEYIVDVNEEDAQKVHLPRNWCGTIRITVDEAGERIFITDGTQIIVMDKTGHSELTIPCGGMEALGMMLYKADENSAEELVVAYSDGSIFRYDPSTGAFIAKSELTVYSNYTPEAKFTVDRESGLLYVQLDELTDVIDLETWIEYAHIENCFGHHAPTDRFMTRSYRSSTENNIGYFRHYTLEDLINKANTILQDSPMPEEMRSQYGL